VQTLWAIFRLTRADSSVLGFPCLLIPIYARTNNLEVSIGRAIPLLFICMCTFISNDLDDLEQDKINHPDRPLPRQHLNLTVAAGLYFICLGMALFLTKYFVDQRIAFWYYFLVAMSISYGYIIEYIPSLKAPYVAVAISTLIFIVAESYPDEKKLYFVAFAGFMFALGRELCMDIRDRTGDTLSFISTISSAIIATVAFGAQCIGLIMLITQFHQFRDIFATGSMAIVLVASGIIWFGLNNHKIANRLMKIQMLIGLYFLN